MTTDIKPTDLKPKKEKLLIKPHEACELLSICRKTLWTLTNAGEIPHVRVRRSVRYRPEALQRWVIALEND